MKYISTRKCRWNKECNIYKITSWFMHLCLKESRYKIRQNKLSTVKLKEVLTKEKSLLVSTLNTLFILLEIHFWLHHSITVVIFYYVTYSEVCVRLLSRYVYVCALVWRRADGWYHTAREQRVVKHVGACVYVGVPTYSFLCICQVEQLSFHFNKDRQ